jgi:hypothetical protein
MNEINQIILQIRNIYKRINHDRAFSVKSQNRKKGVSKNFQLYSGSRLFLATDETSLDGEIVTICHVKSVVSFLKLDISESFRRVDSDNFYCSQKFVNKST